MATQTGDGLPAAVAISTSLMPGARSSKRVLEPAERIAEVLFGLIMVLTFTGSLSVAEAGSEDVSEMLVGALGCNLAWAIIDGIFYLMGCLAEKGRNLATYKAVLAADTAEERKTLIVDVLPPVIASLLTQDELGKLQERAARLPEPPKVARLDRRDWMGGWAVFLLVFASTFPVALPFMFLETISTAMRVSNAIAVAMLFIAGYAYGRIIHRSPVAIGGAAVFIGLIIVGFTIALGG
jgi:VIT1/CCC1 family predicted Fe2+/Mn2+ transporter